MKTFKYILKRIGLMLMVFMVIMTICFILVRMLPVASSEGALGVQAQIEEVRKEPIVIQQPQVLPVQNEIEKVQVVTENKPVVEDALDAQDEEFEKKLIDTLHSIIPDFDLEEGKSVDIEPENMEEPQELVERKTKKSHFNFLKGSEKSKNEQVKELYMEGLSEVEIAQKLSIGRGEVRLIIGLMER